MASPIPPATDASVPTAVDAPVLATHRYIADINGLISTKSKHFQIVVCVMSMWKILDNTKKKEVKSPELCLIDAQGDKIQATIPVRFIKDFIDQFE
ncbi:OLC1v1024604C1 [Oldenlandia corymbosa var. corymbosa]|uniref:OLC1v1024604C1 n=1 Tax=Oldenlandia corymbosa var. corymbosa TaxID=529605 RepID=A0AAV1C4J2_OLDCO|nr:OLC1v1024604C1 [Oldenlandia corymbosa var. corymbosa]